MARQQVLPGTSVSSGTCGSPHYLLFLFFFLFFSSARFGSRPSPCQQQDHSYSKEQRNSQHQAEESQMVNHKTLKNCRNKNLAERKSTHQGSGRSATHSSAINAERNSQEEHFTISTTSANPFSKTSPISTIGFTHCLI